MNQLESLSCFVVVMAGVSCGATSAPLNSAPDDSSEASRPAEIQPAESVAAVAAPIIAPEVQETSEQSHSLVTARPSVNVQAALDLRFGDGGGSFLTSDGMKISVTKSGGGLSAGDTRRVLEMARSAFIPCMSHVAQGEGLESRATFLVSPKGALSRVRLSGGSSKVRACLRDSLGRVLFPDAAKTTAVVATFTKERGLGGIGILSGSSSHGGFRQRGASQKPSMQIKSFKSTGALASAVTLRVMRMHRHRMLYCFERELQKNPAFAANVSLELRIGADGRVAKFTTKTANRALKMCLEQLVRAVRFPKGRGDTVVTQQIEFRPLARTILQKRTATRP